MLLFFQIHAKHTTDPLHTDGGHAKGEGPVYYWWTRERERPWEGWTG